MTLRPPSLGRNSTQYVRSPSSVICSSPTALATSDSAVIGDFQEPYGATVRARRACAGTMVILSGVERSPSKCITFVSSVFVREGNIESTQRWATQVERFLLHWQRVL